jgi:EAL domain-containing protein (putative c-di-GMP-specific phosphodiesterase class I)
MHTRQSTVGAIRTALEGDCFGLVAQPIVSVQTGAVVRHELLIRMRGESGIVMPAQFLPVAEQTGLIEEIDAWVLHRTFAIIRELLARGEMPHFQINLSGGSVSDPTMLDAFQDEMARGDVPGECLSVEITETSAISDMAQAQRFGRAIRDLGCGLSLDDFGAGFGSFHYLKHLPFDSLKIDGEFIRGITESAHDQEVVRALTQIASALGLDTIAEFVEDPRTLDLLRDVGVTYAQGYALGAPTELTLGGDELHVPQQRHADGSVPGPAELSTRRRLAVPD